jgi:hypothetical protein
MTVAALEEKMKALGFPLMEVQQEGDVNETLAEVVQSQDARYWEGFPVLLANAAKSETLSYQRVEQYLLHPDHRDQLKQLFLMSLALYEVLNLKFAWLSKWRREASEDALKAVKDFQHQLAVNQSVEVAGRQFFAQRLKEMFVNYFEKDAAESKALELRYEHLSLEYALSQLFSPKQKELFNKRLNGERMTKTEREYFSRTVKRKVVALANVGAHRLARRLLEH